MSHPDPPAGAPPPVRWTAAGIALLVLGLLILVPSGLCTAFVGIPMVFTTVFSSFSVRSFRSSAEQLWFFAFLVGLIGGVPIAIGGALVRAGLKKLRRRD